MAEETFGHYRLQGLLGRGGMGHVYRAYDTTTDRVVALKVLPPHAAEDRTFQERFRREAHVAAGLTDPHVVPIHRYGEIDGRLYVDMRLIEGRDLGEVLREAGGPLPPARVVRIIEQVAEALDAAHSARLVHRDIKPSNILVTRRDFVYLIDFGIARAGDETRLTSTGAAIGTFAYMAPERFETLDVEPRSDVYSLACVLHECLTGQQPFAGGALQQQIAAHMTKPPPKPSAILPMVPPGFDDVVAKGMAKDPNQRHQTALELADAARGALDGRPSYVPPMQQVPPSLPPTQQAPRPQSAPQRFATPAVAPVPPPRPVEPFVPRNAPPALTPNFATPAVSSPAQGSAGPEIRSPKLIAAAIFMIAAGIIGLSYVIFGVGYFGMSPLEVSYYFFYRISKLSRYGLSLMWLCFACAFAFLAISWSGVNRRLIWLSAINSGVSLAALAYYSVFSRSFFGYPLVFFAILAFAGILLTIAGIARRWRKTVSGALGLWGLWGLLLAIIWTRIVRWQDGGPLPGVAFVVIIAWLLAALVTGILLWSGARSRRSQPLEASHYPMPS